MKLLRSYLTVFLLSVWSFQLFAFGFGGGDPAQTAPNKPYNVTVPSSSSTGNYSLTWSKSYGGASYYEVFQSKNGSNYSRLGQVSGTLATYALSSQQSATYTYQLRACNTYFQNPPLCSAFVTSNSISVYVSGGGSGGSGGDGIDDGTAPSADNLLLPLSGSGGVSGGAANYSIGIQLPPGRAGMQPSASLNYSSRSGYGLAGIGWNLSIGSSIHRCGKIADIDGYNYGVTYSATHDRLCLNGSRLKVTNGYSYGSSGAQYRTEMDQFARVTQYGAINSTSSYFKVEAKDGRVSYFGTENHNKHSASGRSEILTWAIDRTEDRSGNSINYQYDEFGQGEHLLTDVYYTGQNNTNGNRRLHIEYRNKNRYDKSYIAGGLTASTKIIDYIQTYVSSTRVLKYELGYRDSASSGKHLLDSVRVCDKNSNCTPATSFEWQDVHQGYKREELGYHNSASPNQNTAVTPILQDKRYLNDVLPNGDITGDGVKDYPTFSTDAEGRITQTLSGKVNNCYRDGFIHQTQCLVIDINQDGISDNFSQGVPNQSGDITYAYNAINQVNTNYVSTGIRLTKGRWQTPNDSVLSVQDLNNDGYPDILVQHIISNTNIQITVYWHTGNTSQPYTSSVKQVLKQFSSSFSPSYKGGIQGSLNLTVAYALDTSVSVAGDFDGNGTSDLWFYQTDSFGRFKKPGFEPHYVLKLFPTSGKNVTTSTSNLSSLSYPTNQSDEGRYSIINDFTGDGLPDWVQWIGIGQNLQIRVNKGGSFEPWKDLGNSARLAVSGWMNGEQWLTTPKYADLFKIADIDNDGKPELLMPGTRKQSNCHNIKYADGAAGGGQWVCGDALYGGDPVGNPWPSSFYDDSIYQWQALSFKENTNGTWSTTSFDSKLMGAASQSTFIDINGDGLQDFITTKGLRWPHSSVSRVESDNTDLADGVYVYRNKGAADVNGRFEALDMMQRVKQFGETQHEWVYRPLSSTEYNKSNAPYYALDYNYIQNDLDYFHFASSMYTVASHKQANGLVNGLNETTYRYDGAVYNNQGRGFQGFRKIIVDDEVGQTRAMSEFHQKFPLAGQIIQAKTCLIQGSGTHCATKPLTHTSTDNSYQQYDTTGKGTYWVFPRQTTSTNYDTDAGAATNEKLITSVTQSYADSSNDRNYGNINRSIKIVTNNTRATTKSGANGKLYTSTLKTTTTTAYDYGSSHSSWWISKPVSTTIAHDAVTLNGSYPAPASGNNDAESIRTEFLDWNTTHRKPSLVQVTPLDNANKWLKTTTSYDGYGQPTTVKQSAKDEADRTTVTAYRDSGYFVGSVTQSQLNLKTLDVVSVDAATGTPLVVKDINGMSTTTELDDFGVPLSVKAQGEPTIYSRVYDCSSSADCSSEMKYYVETTQNQRPTTRAFKDKVGRTLQAWTQSFKGSWIKAKIAYDHRGRKTFESVPAINSISQYGSKFYYNDPLGRMTKRETDDAYSTLIVNYSHYGASTVIHAQSGGSHRYMSRTYNGLTQLVETQDTRGNLVNYTYDNMGNPIVITHVDGSRITASYDALGHKETVIDPDMGSKSFLYNAFGELKQENDANGNKTVNTYDALGRQTRRHVNNAIHGTWYYDDSVCKGLLSKEIGGLERHFTYYTNSCKPKNTSEKISATTYTNTVTYTNTGLLDTLQYPSDIKLKYTYTSQGYLNQTKNANTGYIYQDIEAMDAWGNWTQAYHGGTSGKVTRNYDQRSGQMTNTHWFDGGSLRQRYIYTYEQFGNLDATNNYTYGFGTFNELFDYDELHRLSYSSNAFSGGSTSINYKFDENGNLLKKTDFSWNADNAYEYKTAKDGTYKAGPHAPWRVRDESGVYRHYFYDNNGNMVREMHGSSKVRTIAYNALNKPTKIKVHSAKKLHPRDPNNATSGTTIDFEYGPNWSRYQQKRYVGSTWKETTKYLMGGAYEVVSRGSNTKKRITIGNHTVVNIKGSSVETNFLHKDRLGSTIGIASTLGNLVESYSFDPFGRPRDGGYKDRWRAVLNSQMAPNANSGTAKDSYDKRTSRGFTDHEQLDDVQYTHMNGRIYDYNLGRFLSVDPFIQEPGNSQSLNPYSYIMNNPLAGTDPSGYISCKNVRKCASGGNPKRHINGIQGRGPTGQFGARTPSYNGKDEGNGDGETADEGGSVTEFFSSFFGFGGGGNVDAEKSSIIDAALNTLTSILDATTIDYLKNNVTEASAILHEMAQEAAAEQVETGSWGSAVKGVLLVMAATTIESVVPTNVTELIPGGKAAKMVTAATTQIRKKVTNSGRSTANLVQEVATRAENKVGGTGAVAGTKKHSYAKKLMDLYQSRYGGNLETEATYLRGQSATYGKKGSTRLDVYDPATGDVYDYKFVVNPGKGISTSQQNKIRTHGPAGVNNIIEVNP